MLGRAEKGLRGQEMAEFGRNGPEMVRIGSKRARNGQKWSKLAEFGDPVFLRGPPSPPPNFCIRFLFVHAYTIPGFTNSRVVPPHPCPDPDSASRHGFTLLPPCPQYGIDRGFRISIERDNYPHRDVYLRHLIAGSSSLMVPIP